MINIVLLDALTFGETDLSGFDALGSVTVHQTTALIETLERIKDADVVVINKVVITAEMMDACTNLKLICISATGMNNVDLEHAKSKGIDVKNVAGYSTDSVIQLTFSMLFYMLGQSRYYDEYVKSGEWQQSPVFTHIGPGFSEVKGKKWGIIGMGAIGRGVASVATAFGAEVCYHSTSGRNSNSEYTQVTLDEMLNSCDIITIHAPLNAQTQDLIGHDELFKMKVGAVLLNLGRGGIVSEQAVADVIDTKEIYIGLDVLAKEPMTNPHPLMSIEHKERLYITPHIAWTSVEAREKLIAMVIDNIKSSF